MDVIRFQCPACSGTLTVRPAAAGFQGQCPKCSVEIVGPDPARGKEAHLPVPEPPPAETFDPFPESDSKAALEELHASLASSGHELIPPSDPFSETPTSEKQPPGVWPETSEAPEKTEEKLPEETLAPPEDSTTNPPETGEPVTKEVPEEPTPAPASTPQKIDQPLTGSSRGHSAIALVAVSLFSAGIGFIGGLSVGRSASEPSEIIAPSEPELQVAPEEAATTPPPVQIPAPPVDSPIEASKTKERIVPEGPEATLKAFLNADGWEARSAYVESSELIRKRMEDYAKESNDGPIQTTRISLFEAAEDAHIFTVASEKNPAGFPARVSRDNNRWIVDWAAFIEFYDDLFLKFASGELGERGIYHVMVTPVASSGGESLFESFSLSPPMPDREQLAYIRRDSRTYARLASALDQLADQSEGALPGMKEKRGVPMVLGLSYRKNSQGQSYLQIDDLVASNWGTEGK